MKDATYPLFIALTRPPMLFGVSQSYFLVSFVGSMCLLILTLRLIGLQAVFFSGGLFAVTYGVGLLGFKRDDYFFDIILGYLEMPCPNQWYWGCISYDAE